MTTATELPLIVPAVDVADMPALDQPDERACEVPICEPDPDGPRCGVRAVWIWTLRCEHPEHDKAETILACAEHLGVPMQCGGCWIHAGVDADLRTVRVEPLR